MPSRPLKLWRLASTARHMIDLILCLIVDKVLSEKLDENARENFRESDPE